jgi:hypothetical protein
LDPKHEKEPNPPISDKQIVVQVSTPWREISDTAEIKRLVHKPSSPYPEAVASMLVRDFIDHPLVALTLKVIYSVSFNVGN